MCYNLHDKKYCIENIQYTAEEYQAKLEEYKKQHSDLYQKFVQ
jgi:hypothetical protein